MPNAYEWNLDPFFKSEEEFLKALEEFKALLQLRKDIREGKVSVVRHRDPSGIKKSIKQLRMVGYSDDEIEKKLKIRINDYLKK
jgi:cell fate (sporulation/competence/biofilm development) regulator YlbF (YheA/YmcA/DUF963 family)